MNDPNWRARAKCHTQDAEALFTSGKEQRRAQIFCRSCPVRAECLAYALDEKIEYGVWGGMTERQRRSLLLQRPDIASWLVVLTRAQQRAAETRCSPRQRIDHGPASLRRKHA